VWNWSLSNKRTIKSHVHIYPGEQKPLFWSYETHKRKEKKKCTVN
jgi:hypothetical protein